MLEEEAKMPNYDYASPAVVNLKNLNDSSTGKIFTYSSKNSGCSFTKTP